MPRFMIIKLGQSMDANSLRMSQSQLTYEKNESAQKSSHRNWKRICTPICDKYFQICVKKAWFLKQPQKIIEPRGLSRIKIILF